MEDTENSRPDIPGLVNKGRKGKKKSNNTTSKKSLTLQTFLHDNKEAAEGSSSSGASNLVHDPMESHFAKLNLDDEELIVMESCHSFIHDMLKHMGPTNAMDPRLQEEINNFPPEAKRVIQKCGGYRNFILRSKDLTVVDKVVAARVDLKRAQEMAFQEISANGRPNSHNPNQSKNEQNKEVWNNKSNVLSHSNNKDFGNLMLSNPPPAPKNVESFINDEHGNSLYYKTSPVNIRKVPGVIGNGSSNSNRSPNGKENSALNKKLSEANEKNKYLMEVNNNLRKQLEDKNAIAEDYSLLQNRFSSLEALHNNTKNELDICKTELEKQRQELAALSSLANMENDKQLIFSLQKKLEAERLKSLNLTQELENHRKLSLGPNLVCQQESLSNNLFPSNSGVNVNGGWEHSLAPMSVPVDQTMLGLRSIFSNDQAPIGPGQNVKTLEVGQLFGGPIGHSNSISRQQSSTSLGLSSMSILQENPCIPSVSDQSTFASMFSVPPPSTPTPPLPTSSRGSPPSLAPGPGGSPVPGAKSGRQEQLVKKLAAMLPGTEEETIKHCISQLRTKYGKLSGWPTSKIATQILDLIEENKRDILQ